MKKEFEEKAKALWLIGEKLKKDFVGLDDPIDKIISSVKIWYCLPEALCRPVIINLWGMTGTGKTDLVRKFVEYLEISSRFLEIQMDSDLKSPYGKTNSVKDALNNSDLDEDEMGVILLDEFQRFSPEENDSGRYTDVWMLLSDGGFNLGSNNTGSALSEEIFEMEFDYNRHLETINSSKKNVKNLNKKGEEDGDDEDEKWELNYAKNFVNDNIGLYKAKKYKKRLKLKEDLMEIQGWKISKLIQVLKDSSNSLKRISSVRYKKLLIFVCGNLDSAYKMSGMVSESQINADFFHEYSKKINVLDIKSCLQQQGFKPEQISRLGNNHIIYPCISSKSYNKIIKLTISKFFKNLKKQTGVKFHVSKAFVSLVYSNSVYPTQGVRPVFSSVDNLLSSICPELVFKSVSDFNNSDIYLDVDKDKNIYAKLNDKKFDVNYKFDLQLVKTNVNENNLYHTAVHEAGHAVIFMVLTNMVPSCININSKGDGSGFMNDIARFETIESLKQAAKVCFGGIIAERFVFGEENRSTGSRDDITKMTGAVFRLTKRLAGGKYNYSFYSDTGQGPQFPSEIYNVDKESTDMIECFYSEAEDVFNKHHKLFFEIVEMLLKNNSIEGEEIHKNLAHHFEDLKLHSFEENGFYIDNYKEMYLNVKNEVLGV